jgi:hypothetical protein
VTLPAEEPWTPSLYVSLDHLCERAEWQRVGSVLQFPLMPDGANCAALQSYNDLRKTRRAAAPRHTGSGIAPRVAPGFRQNWNVSGTCLQCGLRQSAPVVWCRASRRRGLGRGRRPAATRLAVVHRLTLPPVRIFTPPHCPPDGGRNAERSDILSQRQRTDDRVMGGSYWPAVRREEDAHGCAPHKRGVVSIWRPRSGPGML